MKTKNVKVKPEDVKQGRIIYVSHPVYGIQKKEITSKPYMISGIGMFVDCIVHFGGNESYKNKFSLNDSGISKGNSRNGKRSFFKLKQAEEWAKKWSKDKSFILHQARHERACQDMFSYSEWN